MGIHKQFVFVILSGFLFLSLSRAKQLGDAGSSGSVVCILQHSQLLSGPTTDNCIPANSCNLIRINVQDTRIIHSYNHIRGQEIYPNGMLTLYHFQFTSCKVMCVMKHRRNTICRKHIRQGRTDILPRGGGCCLLLYY